VLGIGSATSRVVAAAAFALSPRVLTTIGSISSETLPIMLAPWVLLPTIVALQGTGTASSEPGHRRPAAAAGSVRRLAGQAGLAVALMGAVNAIATLAGCLPALIWWACHRPNRVWWRYTAWWLAACALAMSWWLVALILLFRISPPFLDFIESSGVTTQWSSLVEVLRGTASWTPFVAPNATAGAPLVTGSVAILATCLVAAAGLAGLAGRGTAAAGRLVTMLLVGVVLITAGYTGGLGSPVAHQVQAFLDAGGAPLRNVHKLETVVRIPVLLGLAQLLGRIPLPGSAANPAEATWIHAFAHPERDKRVAAGIVVLTALMTSTALAWTGRLTPPGTFSAIPRYWHEAADWLTEHNTGAPAPGRVLVVPGAPFATQLWGTSHDEPLQVLGNSPWGVRDSIPLTPPQTIRAMDSVQRLLAAGRPSAGLADTLVRQGISYVVLRNDLDPDASRSARPILVHRAIAGSPRLQKVAQFGTPVGPGPVPGFINDSGLRPRYPAVEIYRVLTDEAAAGNPGAPYLANTDQMARVSGGPEALLRLDERRRMLGQPPLGPVLMTSDATRAGLPMPRKAGVTVTDTPVARETDYGRVDDHSSAVRTADDARHTFNRVPDYPAPGAATVYGGWTGGRLTVSSSSADATALPDVATATSPAAAIDGDPATAWVSNGLQSAVGQWLQVDFDHPVTNALITITPSATAVGAQVRKIQVSTVTGTTTLRFDEAGKPLTAALPVGETPWMRITAIGTEDGSPGVQFGITDLSITQYDASGFAHPVDLRHTVAVPNPPPDTAVARWDLGSELLGRPGCAEGPAGDPRNMHCAASMALAPEVTGTFSRMLRVPKPVPVIPAVWVRARQVPKLAALIAEPDTTQARGDSDLLDVLGSAYAATDGDPATAWTAPQRVVQHKTPPTLTVTLPRPTLVTGVRLAPGRSSVPAHPTMVAINLGDGPQVRELKTSGSGSAGAAEPQRLSLKPLVTDTVTISLLDWENVIDRTAVGFDQLKPPGLAEIAVLGSDGKPVAAADATRNRAREITVDCAHGPVIAIAGRFVHTAIRTTVGALLDGEPVPAQACERQPIMLPAGQQELLISPGEQFVVDGAQLSGPLAAKLPTTTSSPAPASTGAWGPARREVQVAAATASRVLVVPESINPGWVARTSTGARLTPVAVNGWQQGWVVPAGTSGTISLTFAPNSLYRAGLAGGLALLPLLALMAWWPARPKPGSRDPAPAARPWTSGRWADIAVLATGAVLAGAVGMAVFGAALGVRWVLRDRPGRRDAVLVGLSAGGLVLAGAALSRHPWRSVDGYAGHSVGVQLLALISLAALAASVTMRDVARPKEEEHRADEPACEFRAD
jgi:arabinofuranan 3-O-arabinosyltransferase